VTSGIETNFGTGSRDRWLLLIHQIPAKPTYLRLKIWRPLQALGAVTVKDAVYGCPPGSSMTYMNFFARNVADREVLHVLEAEIINPIRNWSAIDL
jgi:hypothetical protein